MEYNTWLKKKNGGKCPFCILKKSEILKANKDADIILSRARYHKDHLLVIPKKHVTKLSGLTIKEKDNFIKLFSQGLEALHKKYTNVSVIYREGTLKGVGKSIPHAHFHLIPNMKVGPYKNLNHRRFFKEETYLKKTKEMKEEIFS